MTPLSAKFTGRHELFGGPVDGEYHRSDPAHPPKSVVYQVGRMFHHYSMDWRMNRLAYQGATFRHDSKPSERCCPQCEGVMLVTKAGAVCIAPGCPSRPRDCGEDMAI